jgi:rhomboid protease GluP
VADKRRMCPHCRAFITTDDKVCPYCDTPVGERAIDRRSPADIAGLIPAARFTTAVILLLNIGLFIASALYSGKLGNPSPWQGVDVLTLQLFGAKYGPLMAAGQWWRLITAGFLHGGLLHIGMNLWVLFDLGTQVEEAFGTRRYLAIYVFSTITGFWASTWWSPGATSVGASAPLFGCIGAMIAFGTMMRASAMGSAIKSHYTRWAVYGFIMGLLPGMRIDNAAHLGGLAGGFVVAYIAGTPRLVDSIREKIWLWVAIAAVALTGYAFYNVALFMMAMQRTITQ